MTTTIVCPASAFNVIEPSPRLSEQELRALHGAVLEATAGARAVASAGSLPSGVSPDFHGRVVSAAHRAGAHVVVDAGDMPLCWALEAQPDLVTPSVAEAWDALHGNRERCPANHLDVAGRLAQGLMERGASAALVTAGSKGAVLATASGVQALPPQSVDQVNPVGAGDALVGGIIAGWSRGSDLFEAIDLGLACAADKVGRMHPCHVVGSAVAARLRETIRPDAAPVAALPTMEDK